MWVMGPIMGIILILASLCIVFAAKNTPENKLYNINMNPDGRNPALYFGEWKNHNYYPSPSDWRKESIYQFITDRFSDGNPSNNEGKYGGYDLRSVSARHGGDFKGVTNKLDYIKSLGFSTIWISPVFQNQENSYHGYAQIDFTLLDDRFGTLEEFRELVGESHRRGIKVIVDIVTNHMADLLYFEGHPNDPAPFHLHTGEYKVFQRGQRAYEDFVINNTFVNSGQYCDMYGDRGEKVVDSGAGSYWESDFHHNGDLRNYGDVSENHLGKIYGIMDDLRTTHPRVQDKLIAMAKSLIASVDIDGIRMDTPMQQPLYFFKRWVPALKEYAASLGKSNFFIFGEFYCSRERAATMTGRGKTPDMYGKDEFIDNIPTMDSGINYPLYSWFMETIKEQRNNLNGILRHYEQDLKSYDFYNMRSRETQYTHVNFFNNHDQWRISASTDGFQKTDLSTAILILWPGILGFYYGDEQGFLTRGTALDGWSREDMMTSLAWKDLPTVNGTNPCETDNFDMTNPHFLWTRVLLNLKRIYPDLSSDRIFERWEQGNNENGIYAITRMRADDLPDDWVLIVFNTWKDTLYAGSPLGNFYTGWSQGDIVVNLLNPAEKIHVVADGKIQQLMVPGYGVKVLMKERSVKPLNPFVTKIIPSHDKVVTNKSFNVTIEFNEEIEPSSISNAVSFNGQKVTPMVRGKYVGFRVDSKDGINRIEIDESVKSIRGANMHGKFISRFRFGSQDNILINPKFTTDPRMVVAFDGNAATLKHRAVGAERFRVQLGNSWTEWLSFVDLSKHIVPRGVNDINVQYWVDGSAAYYVKTTLK
jgi:alpha-1,3-glucan synthase